MYTSGFSNVHSKRRHFERHKDEFKVVTQDEYENLADEFLGGPITKDTEECIRQSDGSTLRYNKLTHWFGVLSAGYIRTFYILDSGGFPDIYKRFKAECNKR